MKASQDGNYNIHSLRMQEHTAGSVFHGVVKSIEVLGTNEKLDWTRDEQAVHIHTNRTCDGPIVFKVVLD